jgi:hypothetical protein
MREDVSPPSITPLPNHLPVISNLTVHAKATTRLAAIGACLGLAWGAALRAWMVVLVLGFGERSHFTWQGTFGGILLPAAIMGAILGAAADAKAASNRKLQCWVLLSPLLLVLGPALATDNFVSILITTGMGGGAIGVALIALLGGYTVSGVGAKWLRWVTGLLALLFTLAAAVGLATADSEATDTPRKVFCALLFALLMALLVAGIGASIQFRTLKR